MHSGTGDLQDRGRGHSLRTWHSRCRQDLRQPKGSSRIRRNFPAVDVCNVQKVPRRDEVERVIDHGVRGGDEHVEKVPSVQPLSRGYRESNYA